MKKQTQLKFTILSMSMLTVMASASVSPALASIQEYFTNINSAIIKMILTIPSLLVVLINFVFPFFSKKISVRALSLIGLFLYTFGGALGGFVNNIYLLLGSRVLLGIGVGFIMPLSTGLLAYYFERSEQKKLMGYSVTMNNLGGIIAISLAGLLASINWRLSFYVYFLGLIIIVASILFIPNDRIKTTKQKINLSLLKIEWFPLTSVFLVMIAFYTYITHFSIQAISENIISPNSVGFMMSLQSLSALCISLVFGKIAKRLNGKVKYVGLLAFLIAFTLLAIFSSKFFDILALISIGLGMGLFFPHINADAVSKIEKNMATTVMAVMTIFIYTGQFLSPPVSVLFMTIFKNNSMRLPYIVSIGAIVLTIILAIIEDKTKKLPET